MSSSYFEWWKQLRMKIWCDYLTAKLAIKYYRGSWQNITEHCMNYPRSVFVSKLQGNFRMWWLVLVPALSLALCGEVALRASSAKGKLLCGSTPYEGAKVKFFRINSKGNLIFGCSSCQWNWLFWRHLFVIGICRNKPAHVLRSV